MSNCHCEGKDTYVFTKKEDDFKDTVTFVTKEDHEKPSTILMPDPEPSPGIKNPDGSINWNCPCLGDITVGPCGVQIREAFTCFHTTDETQISNCASFFKEVQKCTSKYPNVYKRDEEDSSSGNKGLNINNPGKNK